MPRYEILSEEAMDVIDRGWRRLVSEIGIEFLLPEAVELLRGAGQKVETDTLVKLDPEFILEQVAKAPREFDLQARNPENTVHIGGENMVFALQTLSDKPYMGSVISGPNAVDTVRMGEILFGSREAIAQTPCSISLINCNSPLRWDDRMLSAMVEYNRANQAVVLTPFLLMGAMSPVSIPATLVQLIAEALSGIALCQLVQPGCPVVFGSFLSNTDMKSGSPSFGTPESAIGLLCTGQIARHFNLPWRSGGGLTASQTADAQSAYEALMTLLPTFLAGTNFVMHSAGWLEGGLVSGYEKFIVDIELFRMLRHEFTPLEIDEASLAFDAHQEVGQGGHFLGAAHTLERFRDCFYRPLLSSTENFERWSRNGGQDAAERAGEIWRKTLDEYEQPPIDEGVRDRLRDYVARRRI